MMNIMGIIEHLERKPPVSPFTMWLTIEIQYQSKSIICVHIARLFFVNA